MKSVLRNLIFKIFNIKQINRLRQIKWFILKPFISDNKLIIDFYRTEIEIRILEELSQQISTLPDQIWLDIGANIGAYSFYISKFISNLGGKCIGFEPREDTWLRLVKNVQAPNFKSERYACSSTNGNAEIYLPPSHGQSSLVKMPEFEGVKTEKVETITLDSYCKANTLKNITFIKIDVEGYEFEVLDGAKLTITNHRPLILCESENRHLHNMGKSTEELIAKIVSFDYRVFVISPKTLLLKPANEIIIPQDRKGDEEYYYNYWFIPNEKTNQICSQFTTILNKLRTKISN